jgi:hypothetical protein
MNLDYLPSEMRVYDRPGWRNILLICAALISSCLAAYGVLAFGEWSDWSIDLVPIVFIANTFMIIWGRLTR